VKLQVAILHLEHIAVAIQKANMLAQPLAVLELLAQLGRHRRLVAGQGRAVGRADRRPVVVQQRVGRAIEGDRSGRQIDAIEEQAVVHGILGVAPDDLSFELELDDRDGLMHAGDRLGRIALKRWADLGLKERAWIIAIDRLGEVRQAAHIDRIAVQQRLEVAIAQR
jgi:hypothetical protein